MYEACPEEPIRTTDPFQLDAELVADPVLGILPFHRKFLKMFNFTSADEAYFMKFSTAAAEQIKL